MHKKLIVILPLCLILMILFTSIVVYAADDDLFKNLNETAQQSGNDYFVKYRDNYELDTEKMSFFKVDESASVILNMSTSFIFLLQKMLASLTISIFSFALSTNIVEILGGFIEPFIAAMKSSLWDSLVIYAISFAAFILLIKMAQNRTSQALSSLIGIVMIIVLAFMFYAYPIKMLEGIDNVTSGISDTVMEGPYQATVGGTAVDAKGKASALCWNLLVHKPWQILEFGDVSTAQKYEADILKLEPGSDKRKEVVQDLAESKGLFSKSAGYQFTRLCIAVITFIFNLMLMIVLIIFSVLIIGYRFLLLVYLVLGIFIFLIALLPNFGLFLVRRWGLRVVSISFTRVIVVFFLSITLVFMDVIYKFIDEYGMFMVMFLMLVIVASLWFERYRLINLFAGYTTNGQQMQQGMNKSLETDYNAINHMRNIRAKALSNLENTERTNNVKGSSVAETRQSDSNKGHSSQSVRFNTSGEASTNINQSSEKMQQAGESIRNTAEDMGAYFKHAEALLQKQYEYSKVKSEETAVNKNEAPEYDSFVKRTNKIRAKGVRNFDNRDVSNVANIMKRTVEQGGSISEVISDGRSIYRDKHQNIQRPESLNAVHESFNSVDPIIQDYGKAEKLSGIKYFKSNFGDEQGEEIYDNLVEKYGKYKLKNYRPYYNNNGRQSFAQVVKQLNENIDTNNLSKPTNKPNKATKLRSGGGKQGG